MTREAKKAAKLEKKLRTLTTGYQSRAQALTKQTQDLVEQIEAARCELDTYKFLKKHENGNRPNSHLNLTLICIEVFLHYLIYLNNFLEIILSFY